MQRSVVLGPAQALVHVELVMCAIACLWSRHAVLIHSCTRL